MVERCKDEGVEVMVATHNQASVEGTVRAMAAAGLNPSTCGLYFGQLLGMADPLTYVLGHNGYRVRACLSQTACASVFTHLLGSCSYVE